MSGEVVTSLQNQRVKDAVKLRQPRQRHKQGRILIDGARELLRAMQASVELIEAFVCETLCQSSDSRQVLNQLTDSHAAVIHVTPAVFAKLAFGDRTDGVLAVARPPRRRLSEFQPANDALVAILEGVEKPGNLGAIVRSADAAGVAGLIVVDPPGDIYNPNAIRSSVGTIFTVPIYAATPAEAIDWLGQHQMHVFAARPDAQLLYNAVDLRGRAAIVLGSEAQGLTAAWGTAAIMPIRLPMLGIADSLNVSVTAAVLFYEAWRQRQTLRGNSDD